MGYLEMAAVLVFKPNTGSLAAGLLIPRSLVRFQPGPLRTPLIEAGARE
jgi:hypothetical protein